MGPACWPPVVGARDARRDDATAWRATCPDGGPRAKDGRAASAVRTQMVAGTRVERASPGGYPGVGTAPTTPLQGNESRRIQVRRSGLSPWRPVDVDLVRGDEPTSSLTPNPFAPAKVGAMRALSRGQGKSAVAGCKAWLEASSSTGGRAGSRADERQDGRALGAARGLDPEACQGRQRQLAALAQGTAGTPRARERVRTKGGQVPPFRRGGGGWSMSAKLTGPGCLG
jgi:hypothetical protein